MISELRTFQTYEHPRFPGVRNSEVTVYHKSYQIQLPTGSIKVNIKASLTG